MNVYRQRGNVVMIWAFNKEMIRTEKRGWEEHLIFICSSASSMLFPLLWIDCNGRQEVICVSCRGESGGVPLRGAGKFHQLGTGIDTDTPTRIWVWP